MTVIEFIIIQKANRFASVKREKLIKLKRTNKIKIAV